ncbi:MAG: ABC transporter ATP-binding protein [Chloroflexi bacterium]|nr:MAG: ABC transporter ATP-binding protein [Chloroflexota bacterium]TMF26483.1 MAG: ABC transporter ATP-binding protein [Chloroflexota bacterium]
MAIRVSDLNAAAVEIESISKRFGQVGRMRQLMPWRKPTTPKLALDRVSLHVDTGRITGILGANGSGKSTLIRILATLLTPDAGRACVFGYDVVTQAADVRRHINRVSVEASFFKEMSPWENMLYAARLYGGGGDGTRSRVEAMLERLGLPLDTLDKPMKQLSRGQQQKVAIARSFLTSPSLLLMDEPTTGLDPRSKREVQDLVTSIRRDRAATVLLCTHDLQEAEVLCDRVVVIDHGRVLAEGTPADLIRIHAGPDGGSLEDAFMRLTGKRLEEDEEEKEE